jgi:hypothetical protein
MEGSKPTHSIFFNWWSKAKKNEELALHQKLARSPFSWISYLRARISKLSSSPKIQQLAPAIGEAERASGVRRALHDIPPTLFFLLPNLVSRTFWCFLELDLLLSLSLSLIEPQART